MPMPSMAIGARATNAAAENAAAPGRRSTSAYEDRADGTSGNNARVTAPPSTAPAAAPPAPVDLDVAPDVAPFDALLLASFGGPERPEDVWPFLENVTRGRGIPRERLAEVAEHYLHFGGRSPINDQNRALLAALRADLAAAGVDVALAWGNRNWDPYLLDALRDLRDRGARRVAVLTTSAYASYSGCRQYREDLHDASSGLDVELTRLRLYFNHPGFVTPFIEATRAELAEAPAGTHVVFVTHSIPEAMDAASGGPDQHAYLRQHEDVASLVAEGAGATRWSLAYCSRSGSPQVRWLEPDIGDHLHDLASQGVESVVVVPIGFVSDHMEVIYDLDTEAAATAKKLGLRFERADTPGEHEAFVAMIRDLVLERAAVERGEEATPATVGRLAPNPYVCPDDCCVNLRAPLPTVS
jgi:ferrochelatase